MELDITFHSHGLAERVDRELQSIITERGAMFVVAYSLLILAIFWHMAGAMSIVRLIVDVAEPLLILAPMIVTTHRDRLNGDNIASIAIYSVIFVASAAIMTVCIWALFDVAFDLSRLVVAVATLTIEVTITTSIGVMFATLLHSHKLWSIILIMTIMSTSLLSDSHSRLAALLAISLLYIIMSAIAEKFRIRK